MDIEKYTKVELHGDSTLLVTVPGGFDPETGQPLAPKEQGFQPNDLKAMRKAADEAVASAQDALAKAQARLAKFDALLAEPVVAQAEEVIAAKVAAAKAAVKAPDGNQ